MFNKITSIVLKNSFICSNRDFCNVGFVSVGMWIVLDIIRKNRVNLIFVCVGGEMTQAIFGN